MWPFKKKPPAAPVAEDLGAAELAWLQQQRDAFGSLARTAGIEPGEPLAAADALIQWWRAEPESGRIDPNLVVNATGVALGDALAARCGLSWRIITDPFGTDLGLWRTDPMIVVSPTHTVAKNFADGPQGFVSAAFASISDKVRQLTSQLS